MQALQPAATTLPVKDEFVVRDYEVCLNNARWHPMSRGAKQAVIDYLDYKAHGVVTQQGLTSPASIAVRQSFGELIGAKPSEIALVNSTTAAENMIVSGLGLHQPGKGNIITDALHFEGSLYLYQELAKRGVDVRIVKPRGWQIDKVSVGKISIRQYSTQRPRFSVFALIAAACWAMAAGLKLSVPYMQKFP